MNIQNQYSVFVCVLLQTLSGSTLCQDKVARVQTIYFQNGMLAERNSVYEGDTIELHESYYSNIIAYFNDTLWEGDSIAPTLECRGLRRIEGSMRRPIGTWHHWYRNGQLEKEYFHHAIGPSRLVNAFTLSGEPLVREGVGVLREIHPHSVYGDSVEYQISDSLRHGQFIGWQTGLDAKESWIRSKGTCIRNVVVGTVVLYYPSGTIERIMNIPNGFWQEYYSNGVLKRTGDYQDHRREGTWLSCDSLGVIFKEETFNAGRLHGHYKEYHQNGRLRVSGHYEFTSGVDSVYTENLETGDLSLDLVPSSMIPSKHGRWLHFNDDGTLLREEEFVLGVLKQ